MAEPKYAGWTKVEASRELKDLKEKTKEGGQLDANASLFIRETVLPQLALDENRPLIEKTRKLIRERLLNDVADDKTYADVSSLINDSMTTLARDEQADPIVRVNAMLLLGELKTKEGKPLSLAAPALAAAAGDANLPHAVRIAAITGVGRHAAAAPRDETVSKNFVDTLASILDEQPAVGRGVEHDWLVSRAVQIVPILARPLPPKIAARLAAFVADETLPIDLRVRSAAALGVAADAQSGVDASALVEAIRKLAVTSLESEEKAQETRRFEEQYRRGGASPEVFQGPPPGIGFDGQPQQAIDPTAIPEQACRRAAWRLYTLGTAIVSVDGKQGLATLMGDTAEQAKKLASQLVAEATTIDGDPVGDTVLDALDVLRPPAPGQKAAKRADRQAEPDEAEGDRNKPADDPNASPFGNPFQ